MYALRYPKMFEICGSKHIEIHPFAYTFNYNDEKYPLNTGKNYLKKRLKTRLLVLQCTIMAKKDVYAEYGFDDQKLNRLIELMNVKLDYVNKHFENDHSFEWTVGFNFIVTGIK